MALAHPAPAPAPALLHPALTRRVVVLTAPYESPPPGFATERSFALRETFECTDAALAVLRSAATQDDLEVDDDAAVALDAVQVHDKLPSCSLGALQRQATALAALGFDGALVQALHHTEARQLPRGHFAGEGAGLFARTRVAKGTVIGLYCGRYELEAEAEEEQRAELTADPERLTPPRILAHLFELGVAGLIVDAMGKDGARCWGGCVNASRRGAEAGEDEPNIVFVRGVRGSRVPGPLPGLRLPLLFAVATRDVDAGAELLMDYGLEYWEFHEAQLARAAVVQKEESVKRKAPARVAARAECDCLRIGSGITPELCPRCNPGQVMCKNGRTLRHRQQAVVATPPAKRPRRSFGPILEAKGPIEVITPSDAEALVWEACRAVPCRASLLALHRELVATVVPAALRTAAEAAAQAAEHAAAAQALSDSVRNAGTEPLRAALMQMHGATLAAEADRAIAAASAAEERRVAAERDVAPLLALRVPEMPPAAGFDAAAACARFASVEPAALLRAYNSIALRGVAAAADELPCAAAAHAVVTAAIASLYAKEAREQEITLARDVSAVLATAAKAGNERIAQDVRAQADALLAEARARVEAAQAKATAARAACTV